MAIAGTNGVELTVKEGDFTKALRYGSAVIKVGDLNPEHLVELQNQAFLTFYSKWWRWLPMFKKHGAMGFVLMGVRLFRAWKGKFFKKFQPVYDHPKQS